MVAHGRLRVPMIKPHDYSPLSDPLEDTRSKRFRGSAVDLRADRRSVPLADASVEASAPHPTVSPSGFGRTASKVVRTSSGGCFELDRRSVASLSELRRQR